MLSDEPFQSLVEVTERRASGELICATGEVEVHVFLQRGRIAWATDSEHPSAFTRHLQRIAQLDADAFQDILESCRREKKPIGETLVSWGAATVEDVRSSLRHQVVLALSVLRDIGRAQLVFLDRTRQFEDYDASLTFELGDLVPNPSTIRPRPAARPPSTTELRAVPGEDLTGQLLEAVDGLTWAELHHDASLVLASPRTEVGPRVPLALTEATVLDGAELVAVRAGDVAVAGIHLPRGRSLWCGIAGDATVGAAFSALTSIGGGDRPTPLGARHERGAPWTIGSSDSPAMVVLRDLLDRAPEALAALLTSLDDATWSCGVGVGVGAEPAVDLVWRRGRALRAPLPTAPPPVARGDADASGFRFRSVATAERDLWCFGAELGTRPERALWLLLDRDASQGLGWAYLTSLSRQLLHLRGWERHG